VSLLGVTLVSAMVTVALVATTVPVMLSVLMLTVKVSAPSVVRSVVGVTENTAEPEVIENEPDETAKSLAADTV
jgi:hypothetical protein